MGLFNRNAKEQNFAGGSKNIMESLQNDFQGDGILVKRDTREDFNTGTVITVNPGEEAVFIRNGEIAGVLSNGRHELSTENYPFLSRIRNMLTGGVSTFTARVYYVRTADTKIEWGTPNGIQFQDNFYGCPTKARGFGEYYVTFRDIPTFIAKLMGNEYMYTTEQLCDAFNGYINSKVFKKVSKALSTLSATRAPEEVLTECSDEMNELVHAGIQEILDEYGLSLVRFYTQSMEIDCDENRNNAIAEFSRSRTGARAMRESAIGRMTEREILGDEYNRIKGMDLLQTLAENPGAGGAASAGAGIGMGFAAAGAFTGLANSVFSEATQSRHTTESTPTFGGSDRFGTPSSAPKNEDPMESLTKMKQLLDAGLISIDQYNDKVKELLSRM